MEIFEPGKGINVVKLNANFEELKLQANTNESDLATIANTALLKNGSNITQDIIDEFNKNVPVVITDDGNISLSDNSENFLTLTGNGVIILPTIVADQYSHTILLTIEGSSYSLDLGTTKSLSQNIDLDTTKPYNVMYIFNKIDNSWYYCLTQ